MDWLRWILLAIGLVLIGAIYVSGRRSHRGPADAAAAADQADGAAPEAPRWHPPADMPDEGSTLEAGLPSGDDALEVVDFELPPQQPFVADPLDPEPEPTAVHGDFDDGPAPAAPGATAEPPPEPASEPTLEPSEAPVEADHEAPAEADHVVVLYLLAPEGERLVGAQLAAAFARHGLEHGELGAFHARARGQKDGATDFSIANVVEPGSFDPATMDTLSTPGLVMFLRLPGPPAPAAALERMLATARAIAEELNGRVLDERRTPLTRQAEQHLRDELQRVAPARGRDRPLERDPR